MKTRPLTLVILFLITKVKAVVGGTSLPRVSSGSTTGDFVIVTEDGVMHGYDSCGYRIWISSIGRNLLNATVFTDPSSVEGPRMVPAIDGSLYVVFPPDLSNNAVRIAHVNATIMSVVAESPFSTPAFPNTYLTGSKLQSLESVHFDDTFTGWATDSSARARLAGRKLMFSINDWTLNSIDVSSQKQLWSLSFAELPPLTQAHLVLGSVEQAQVSKLASNIEIVTSAVANKVVMKRIPSTCEVKGSVDMLFPSQVLGVYAMIEPPDTKGNLVLVLVGKNSPIPTNFGGLPEGIFFNRLVAESIGSLPGVRVEYSSEGPVDRRYQDPNASSFPLVVGGSWPPAIRPSGIGLAVTLPEHEQYFTEAILSRYRVIDFLGFKFSQLNTLMKVYVILVTILAIYLSRLVFKRLARLLTKPPTSAPRKEASPSISILLPDGTALRQIIPPTDASNGTTTLSISSPTSTTSGARLVLIPSEAIQPYEVVKVGQSDSVEFAPWQNGADIEVFDKKIRDISQRTAKLPFAHSATSRRPSLETGNATVLFLGRNVDEPKLVFRNPRAESELQRPNIPIFTQSIRNAVASSALRESPNLRAYVPRAVCGSWNTFDGVFQEYVPKPKTASAAVSLQSFREYPESAVDTALLVMLLRDTDAHDGNYTRDIRRKIALFDLGCCLADRPLPADPLERMALDNFEIWKRVAYLLKVPFESRHIEFIEGIDFSSLKTTWSSFHYQDHLVESARLLNSRLVHPTVMIRILELHAHILLTCARRGRSLLFAAELLYGGTYDDTWLEVGELNLDELERRLVAFVESKKEDIEIFPTIADVREPEPDSPIST